jgi:hypothetical protein
MRLERALLITLLISFPFGVSAVGGNRNGGAIPAVDRKW